MKKLIYQDDDSIQAKLREVERTFPFLEELNRRFKPFLGELTPETLNNITYHHDVIKLQYIKAVETDVAGLQLSTPTAKANILSGGIEDINKLLKYVEDNIYELKDAVGFVSFTNGKPYISKESKELIAERFRIYTSTEIGQKAYELHCEAIEAFNRFLQFAEENLDFRFTTFKTSAILQKYARFDMTENKFKPALYYYDSLIKKTTKHEH